MQLTGKEIIEKGIITNYTEEGIQQQGIDVRIEEIYDFEHVDVKTGYVPAIGKTTIPKPQPLMPINPFTQPSVYYLMPGYYEIKLKEGCIIPPNATLHFKTRSSLVRCGAIVHSGQFDAGFKTEAMGCFLQVIRPIHIEIGARIAQAIVFESNNVENLYNGQWQGDKQRV